MNNPIKSGHLRVSLLSAVAVGLAIASMVAVSGVATAASSPRVANATRPLEKGLKAFVIPKNLGNSYFTTSDSVKSGGALFALRQLGELGTETSGTAATPSSQIPAIEGAITKGANILIISATDPDALCPTLKGAMARGITVVTYDADAPACRDLWIEQATSQGIGDIEVDIIAKEMHDTGQLAIVSAAPTAPNQNVWIGYMKTELKKFPHIQLVKTVYGMDDTATSTTVTEGLLTAYPNLKGIISPTTVGVAAAAAVLDTAKYRGKIFLTGLGTPLAMKKYVLDGTVPEFALWNPANLGYLAAYAAVNFASGVITNAVGQSFKASTLGKYTVGPDQTILLGLPFIFNKSNIAQFHF
ncbi:MAG: substrate-binding domain-containing protein [Acidimicrobiales bacterium]